MGSSFHKASPTSSALRTVPTTVSATMGFW
jgi:hypothetical protein